MATEMMAKQAAWLRRVEAEIRRQATDPDHRVVWADLMRAWRSDQSEADAVRNYLSAHHIGEGS